MGHDAEQDLPARRAEVAARTHADLLAATLTVSEAAALAGVSIAYLQRRVERGSLGTVNVDGETRVPRWQFDADGDTLPGLRTIVAAIPAALHPLAVESFMTTPRFDFDGMSPVEWLVRGGGDPAAVAAWLEGLGRT